ncbi:neuropeptide Y receptor type 2 [Malaya genurostris]|uniref:neuropeptide Y receptor type 2 n=1 Tax=Malaya genurostris TaxID=325434 RepID=UPI0026F37EA8|nr:neuropeptide Y receptor type 2 [Malaya genurostris]XP_058457599.1 neuropeptide Y receptor type 2 [Malaya genurostris]XP_058457600.1 neuropeptide Y receptor type 2 [Malaya genurostris]XP_058457601.1 neuropeptide Y receptor type 2 [Malaya genurostris]XP_058457602.1 neuropeptide Y receptor type 2 [Malaya genurostris]
MAITTAFPEHSSVGADLLRMKGTVAYEVAGSAVNMTIGSGDIESNGTGQVLASSDVIISNRYVQMVFCILYSSIFILGIFGNVLVCYVVFRNKAMQSVTNLFITNLALSDILLCVLAVPFTPLYTFLGQWVFGELICHTVPLAQGCSVYISTLTLTSIAIDRFFVIIFPFHPRMKLSTCITIIVTIWIFSLVLTLPYGWYMRLHDDTNSSIVNHTLQEGRPLYCEEMWPTENLRMIFSTVTSIQQFGLPFFIMAFCYISVSIRLNDRARTKPGSKTTRREEAERDRKKRTNRMLIAMVAIFGISWLPLNLVNICNDFYSSINSWPFYNLLFFIAHLTAMSSTCYNPFLYAWLNENFRKEFKQVLPCFDPSRGHSTISFRRSEHRNCNGNNDTVQETLVPSTQMLAPIVSRSPNTTTSTTVTSESARHTVDSILLSEVGPPTISPPLLPSIQNQETILLPSGVLETPFEVLLPVDGGSKSSSQPQNANGMGNRGLPLSVPTTSNLRTSNPNLQSLILINDGTCGDTKLPEIL